MLTFHELKSLYSHAKCLQHTSLKEVSIFFLGPCASILLYNPSYKQILASVNVKFKELITKITS